MKIILLFLLILKIILGQDTRIKGGCGVKPNEAPWLVFIRNGGTNGDCPAAPTDDQIKKQIAKIKPPEAVTETPEVIAIPAPCADLDFNGNPCENPNDPETKDALNLPDCELKTHDEKPSCVPAGSDLHKDGMKSCPEPCQDCYLNICSHKKPGTNEKEHKQLDDCDEKQSSFEKSNQQASCSSAEIENQITYNQKVKIPICPSIDENYNFCTEINDETGERYQPELPDCPPDADGIPNCYPSGSEAEAQGKGPVCPEPIPGGGGICTPNITGTDQPQFSNLPICTQESDCVLKGDELPNCPMIQEDTTACDPVKENGGQFFPELPPCNIPPAPPLPPPAPPLPPPLPPKPKHEKSKYLNISCKIDARHELNQQIAGATLKPLPSGVKYPKDFRRYNLRYEHVKVLSSSEGGPCDFNHTLYKPASCFVPHPLVKKATQDGPDLFCPRYTCATDKVQTFVIEDKLEESCLFSEEIFKDSNTK